MAGASSLRVGDRVRVQGLASRPELNGRHGKALRFVKESSRWKVWLDGEAKDSSLALKAENIQVLPKYGEALARTALAGRRRAALEPGTATRLHTVHVLGATEWELSLQYAALAEVAAPRVGDRVQLVGLESKPELNGSCGVSERFLTEKGRWKVVLDDKPKGSSLVIKPENLQVIPTYDKGSIEGPWLQEGDRHVVRGSRVFGPEGETVEDIEVTSPRTFTMQADGEVCTATLQPDGKSLSWSDGDVWHRPPADDVLLEVVLIGPELPESHPEGELQRLPDWPEPGVSVACFRGRYEDFAASSSFASPGLTVLAHPAFCSSGGATGGFFSWAPALHALASSGSPLCVCTGTEPYDNGDWLGDGVYDEMVLKGCGFEILAPTERNTHGCLVKEHPSCGWHLWAFTVAFRWPKGKEVKPKEDWIWQAYYACRRHRCELPRFRFRPTAPELKPELLKQREHKFKGEGEEAEAEKAEGEAEKDGEKKEGGAEASETKGGEPSTRLMDDEEEDVEEVERVQDAEPEKPSEDDEEKLLVAGMEWVGSTVQAAWSRGAGACKAAAAAAAAIAAAEEFADRTRSRPLPPGHQHVPACGACELAARIGASVDGGNVAVAAACAAVVTVFECLAYEALWNQHGCFTIDMVGHVVLGGLKCAEKAGVRLESGVASAVGAHASDAYELLSGPNQPPVKSLVEEFTKLAEKACESAGAEASERKIVAQAVADNLDLSIPARGGREATFRISCKMHDAPRYQKVPEPEN